MDEHIKKRREILCAMDLRHEELAVVKNDLDKHRQRLEELNKFRSRLYEPGSDIEQEIQSTMEQVERYEESFRNLKRAMDKDEDEVKRIHISIEECRVEMVHTLDNINELRQKLEMHIKQLQKLKKNVVRRASLTEARPEQPTEHDDIQSIELHYWDLINRSKSIVKMLGEKCELLQNELKMLSELDHKITVLKVHY